MSIFSEGQVYFIVTFVDRDLAIPVVQTIRYCGESESREDGQLLLFDQLEAMGEPRRIFVRPSDAEDLVLSFEKMISVLSRSLNGEIGSKGIG